MIYYIYCSKIGKYIHSSPKNLRKTKKIVESWLPGFSHIPCLVVSMSHCSIASTFSPIKLNKWLCSGTWKELIAK